MKDFINCKVTFTPPDLERPAVLDELLYCITKGTHLADFVRDVSRNEGGKYDELYEEDNNVNK